MFVICHWLILVLRSALSPPFGERILRDALISSLCGFRVCVSAAYVASSCLVSHCCRNACEAMNMFQKRFVCIFLHASIFCTCGVLFKVVQFICPDNAKHRKTTQEARAWRRGRGLRDVVC